MLSNSINLKNLSDVFEDKAVETGEDEPINENTKLPHITPEMLPNSIGKWVGDVCERIESPFEIGAVTALTLIGNLIGNKVGIRPKAKDSWTVTPNIWGMIIGNPSIKKTPVYNELYKAVSKLEAKASKEFCEAYQDYELELEVYKTKSKELKKDGDLDKLKSLTEPIKPIAKRYTTSDGTIEAIADIISNNPNGLLVSRDELSGFLKMMDKQGKEGDRAFYLAGWNGTNSFSVDRIMRGSTYIPRLTLGVLGNIQPSMIKQYVYEAVQGNKADGFLQRFQLTVFAEAMEQKLIDRYPNELLRDHFHKMLETIVTVKEFKGTQKDDFESIPFYRFDDKAQIVFNNWYLNNYKEAQNAFNEAYEGHLSKYPKLFASLCLIFHICEPLDYGDGLNNYNIDENTARKVVKLVNVLKAHAEKLYSTYEIEEAKKDQMTDNILEFIATQTLPIKYGDVTHKVKGKQSKVIIKKAISGAYKDSGSKIVSKI
jgi:hypothetical protein